MCEGRRAGLLLLCVQGALQGRTFPGAGRPFPLVASQAGEDSGAKAMITAPCREPLRFPCSLWDTWILCVQSPCTEGTHQHPIGPGLSAADIHRLVSWWPGDHSTYRSSSHPVCVGSSASDLESLTYFIATMTPPSTYYHPILQIGIPRD